MRCLRLILLISLLSGCRTFEIGFVQTPTLDRITATPTTTATLTPAHTATNLPTSMATPSPTATAKPIVIRPTRPIEPTPTATPTLIPEPEPPTILNFSVEPREVNPGESVMVRWSTANGAATIKQTGPDDYPYYGTGFSGPSGEQTQSILERERLWHAFQLIVYQDALSRTQTITVSIRCPYIYFFSPLPEADREMWSCPDGSANSSSAAEQVFENGRMIWLEHDDVIYVFFDDGKYRTFENAWVAGQPETVPGLTPPQGRYAPVRGFGKVWSGDEEVRSRLGWALAAEQGFEAQLQGGWIHCCSQLGTVNRPIYLRNIEGRILRLWPGEMPPGQWRFITP